MTDQANIQQMQQDVAFVRNAVEDRQRTQGYPLFINASWGIVNLVGFALCDFYPTVLWLYWPIACPATCIAGEIYCRINKDKIGEWNSLHDRRSGWHWGGMGIAIGLMWMLAGMGEVPPQTLGGPLLIMIGLAYYLGGVHLDKAYIAPGIIMIMGATVLPFTGRYTFTITGVLMCMALIGGTLLNRHIHGRQK